MQLYWDFYFTLNMETYILILLCLAAFAAGFVDAIVGGGGLIQTPVVMVLFPTYAVSSIIGTLKIPGFSGTSIATIQYLKKVKVNWKLIAIMSPIALTSAYLGSTLLTKVSNDFMKPLLLIILVLLAIYTFKKKNFGQHVEKFRSTKKQIIYALLISLLLGFYDGFIGPGAGSLLIVAFVGVLGFDFLQASTNAKLINLVTNIGSIILFASKGKIIWAIAIPMAICNAIGGWLGAKLAISKGNGFIRTFFLIIVIVILARFGYDVFFN